VYVDHAAGALALRCVRAPTSAELTELAQRIGRFLEQQGLLEQDAECRGFTLRSL
jgi:thiaminase